MARTHAFVDATQEELVKRERVRRGDVMSELEHVRAHVHRGPPTIDAKDEPLTKARSLQREPAHPAPSST